MLAATCQQLTAAGSCGEIMSHDHVARMGHIDDSVTIPSSPPIFQTAAFDIPDVDVLHDMVRGDAAGHIYTRDSNPNHQALAQSIAILEGTEAGAVFSSGMGALSSVFLALASAGDHVIVAAALYGRTLEMARRVSERFGIDLSIVEASSPKQFAEATTPRTKFALIETVSNPMLEVADISAIAESRCTISGCVWATFFVSLRSARKL